MEGCTNSGGKLQQKQMPPGHEATYLNARVQALERQPSLGLSQAGGRSRGR
jgi:hypothetical protein